MKIKTKDVRNIVALIDDTIEDYKKSTKKKRDWRTYEQKLAKRMKTAIRELEPIIDEAIDS
ncbi:MAG: hypothetical protein U9Q69_02880, partial [Nanoarchaeota archaeon]|nr:hypothetical protein [Nanoarchaeota archaeon]